MGHAARCPTYNTITSLAESPLPEGLLYAGTDDGLIQVSEDGGANWRRIEVGSLPGVPATAFVNDIKADLHDADTVYVALDNHKYGDFEPVPAEEHRPRHAAGRRSPATCPIGTSCGAWCRTT